MRRESVHLTILFFLLVFLQVLLFDNIHLFGFATPLLYIFFLIKLPVRMNRNLVMFLSALLGLVLDVFGNTLGLTMLVMVISGFLRYYLIKLFTPRDFVDDCIPSFDAFGKYLFLRYAGLISLIHITLLYLIESLTFFNPVLLFLRIVSSFTITFILIFAFESINIDVFKK